MAVRQSVTAAKDQTYALYNLTQGQLKHTLMPVGDYTKDQIRAMAEETGIRVAHKPDSQEICFVPDNDYAGFIERSTGCPCQPGNFVDREGHILGTHRGIIHYTIGQRKGLNLSMGHPVFVTEIRPDTNEVVIGESEDLFGRVVRANHVNFMAQPGIDGPVEAFAKIRYNHRGDVCTVEMEDADTIRCTFKEPVRAAAPGQALVIYQDGYVLGGGTIIGGEKE